MERPLLLLRADGEEVGQGADINLVVERAWGAGRECEETLSKAWRNLSHTCCLTSH